MRKSRDTKGWLRLGIRGMAMGAADLVPGVSGGTVAFISGIYEELLDTIAGLGWGTVRTLFAEGPSAAWHRYNLGFLAALVAGIGLSVALLAGTLHHGSTGIPGGRGLFTAIWTALKSEKGGFIKLTPDLRAIFSDFKWLFSQIATSPINIAQIIPQLPTSHGYTDACKHATGGVWLFHLNGSTHRILWSVPFPPDIITKMETAELSINDLEMAGVFLGWLVLEYWIPNMVHHQAGIQCDNSSTVAWSKKFTARSTVAGHLLRALALRQQLRRAAPLLVIPIPGDDNKMADVASRYSSDPSLSAKSDSLLSYFNHHFKQDGSWTSFHLPQKLVSRVMSSLRGQQLTLESWRRIPKAVRSTGTSGPGMLPQSISTPSSKTQTPSSEIQSLPHSLLGSGQAALDEEIKSKFRPLLKLFRPLARQSKWLDSRAPSTGPTTSIHSPFSGASKECDAPTHQLFPNSLSASKSQNIW